LLGEANQNEADFAEDREDDEVSDEEDSSHGDDNLADSLAFSKTNDLKELDAPPREELATPQEQNIEEDNTLNSQTENAMWDMVISKHGKKEFDTCYHIIGKFKSDRFSETAQK